MLLSRKQYSDWKEIQYEYDDFMTSLNFESLNDIEEYIKLDYKLTSDEVKHEIGKWNNSASDTIEI